MIYYWQLMQSRSVSTQWWVTETALEDQEGMLSLKELSSWSRQNVALYGWAGISADGEIWSMHKSDTRCTVGERGGQRAEEIFFMFKSFILPKFIKYEFLFSSLYFLLSHCIHECKVTSVMSNSVWPYGLYSLPGSSVHEIFPGKNTGVGTFSSRGSSWSRNWTRASYVSAVACGFFTTKWLSVSCSVVSDSLRPYGLYPTRLLCPWDSPGKITGVGCHSLLQGIFLTQESKPSLPHCRQILYHLSHQGSPLYH